MTAIAKGSSPSDETTEYPRTVESATAATYWNSEFGASGLDLIGCFPPGKHIGGKGSLKFHRLATDRMAQVQLPGMECVPLEVGFNLFLTQVGDIKRSFPAVQVVTEDGLAECTPVNPALVGPAGSVEAGKP